MESQNYYLLGKHPSHQSIFMGAILDIYKHVESGLFGFTYYQEVGKLQVFNGQPIYPTRDIALREAKKHHILTNVSSDTKTVTIVCDLATDLVIGQSKLAIKLLGKIDGTAARNLYVNESDRDNIRQSLEKSQCFATRSACSSASLSHLKTLDKVIETAVSIKLVKIDQTTTFSVEQLASVHHFP